MSEEKLEHEKAVAASRESTKKLVGKAQEFMQRTNNHATAPLPKDDDTIRWLIETGRSLAGSVISQADPTD
jgi:hypothetical protein